MQECLESACSRKKKKQISVKKQRKCKATNFLDLSSEGILFYFFFLAAAPSLSGIQICYSERKQCRGLRQEEFPRDARVHEKIQCPGNARWHTSSQVGL